MGDNRVRFFVALFDYVPQTMSPNPDAADEVLPFQEEQMIKEMVMLNCAKTRFVECSLHEETIVSSHLNPNSIEHVCDALGKHTTVNSP
ncbi:hypothetical protein TNCV_1050461 [Trichonephila clavipes]|nr:hypothetical protein TNCV_1050461 [Trichonephila clavipes]